MSSDNGEKLELCGKTCSFDLGLNGEKGIVIYVSCQREKGHEGRCAASASRNHLTWESE